MITVLVNCWHLFFFFLSFFLDQCRHLVFGPAKAFKGKRLKNHMIRETDVINEDLCMTLCYMEPKCVSYNCKKTTAKNEVHKCELNNSTHEGHENDLEEDPNYKYHGAEVRILSLSFIICHNFLPVGQPQGFSVGAGRHI